jgi:hypothetical protein
MKQRDVNFRVKRFLTKDDYEKAGCPVQYFEFRDQEYYGLVAVKTDLSSLDILEKARAKIGVNKAFEVYVETIGGESVDKIKMEGYPTEISKSEALLKFLLAPDNLNESVQSLISQFEEVENNALLVDGSLV